MPSRSGLEEWVGYSLQAAVFMALALLGSICLLRPAAGLPRFFASGYPYFTPQPSVPAACSTLACGLALSFLAGLLLLAKESLSLLWKMRPDECGKAEPMPNDCTNCLVSL